MTCAAASHQGANEIPCLDIWGAASCPSLSYNRGKNTPTSRFAGMKIHSFLLNRELTGGLLTSVKHILHVL